jgi:undecaprenyl diphosphate synthase
VEGCVELGVKVLTLYTFSLENWERTEREVRGLMRILEQVLREEREELKKNNVTLRTIGRVDLLPREAAKSWNRRASTSRTTTA